MSSRRTVYLPVRYATSHKQQTGPTNVGGHASRLQDLSSLPNIDDEADDDESGLNRLNDNNQAETVDAVQNDEQSLEEVYLCNCCGVTRELDPAMRYMPLFKTLFFLFNFFVFVFGFANLGMGLWFRIDPKVYEIHKYVETQNFTIAGWIMLFGGFLACLAALTGFAASVKQSVGALSVYLGVISALTCAFIATVVLLTVHGLGRQLENFLTKEIYEQIRRRTMNTELDLFMDSGAAQFLDFVQVKMRCCGAVDFRDYQKLGMVIPTTCYTIAANFINAPGCGRAIRELFDIRAGLATGFATGSVIVQLIAIVLSASMVCSIYHWRANPRPARSTPTPALANTSRPQGASDEDYRRQTRSKQFEPMSRKSPFDLHSIRI